MAIAEVLTETADTEALNLKDIADVIFTLSIDLHQQFDQEIWLEQCQQQRSYHNDLHVNSAVTAAKRLVTAAVDKGIDPLGILEELQKWNADENNQEIQPSELADLFIIAFSLHDLGNIMNELFEFHQNGYQAKGAEARSAAIAKTLLSEYVDEEIIAFIQHLILETTYQDTKNLPFAQVMRVIDQIGSIFLTEDQILESQLGLLDEMRQEQKQTPTIDPHHFFNFLRQRSTELMTDQEVKEVIKIWDKELPKEKSPQDWKSHKNNYQVKES